MKYQFIMEHRKEFRLGKMCEVLEVSRSGYHNYVKRKAIQRRLENQCLLEQIKKIFSEYRGVYGSPRIYQELRRRGIICNRKTVARLMRKEGLHAKARKKYKVTTNSNHNYPVAENILERTSCRQKNFSSRKACKNTRKGCLITSKTEFQPY